MRVVERLGQSRALCLRGILSVSILGLSLLAAAPFAGAQSTGGNLL
jgi:hypothetical protein